MLALLTLAFAAALPSTFAKTIHIAVGQEGLVFSPDHVTADIGDVLDFGFYPKMHSVAQSSFAKPCVPLNGNAIFSGIITADNGRNAKSFQVTVEDKKPLWIYCSYAKHCADGMAMVVNQPNNATLDAYKRNALNTNPVSPAVVGGGTFVKDSASNDNSNGSTAAASMVASTIMSSAAQTSSTTSTGTTTAGTSATSSSSTSTATHTGAATRAIDSGSQGLGWVVVLGLGCLIGGLL